MLKENREKFVLYTQTISFFMFDLSIHFSSSSGMMPAYNFRPKILEFWSSLNAPRKSCKKINKCFKLDSPDFTAQTDYFKLYPIKSIHNHPKQFYVSIKQEITSTLKLLSLTCYAFFKHQTKRPEWASEGIELIRG